MISKNTNKAYQRMFLSGKKLNLIYPNVTEIEAEDIAFGLSRHSRWNGQTKGSYPYSIARHSILVKYLASIYKQDPKIVSQGNRVRKAIECELYALLHDASEYVMSDLITGFKAEVGKRYEELEEDMQRAVYKRFGLDETIPSDIAAVVKKADMTAAYYEMHLLNGRPQEEAEQCFGLPNLTAEQVRNVHRLLVAKPWDEDHSQFLKELDSLLKEHMEFLNVNKA